MPQTWMNGFWFALGHAVAFLCAVAYAASAEQTITLEADLQATTTVETRIEVSGHLKLLKTVGTNDGGKSRKETNEIPVSVTAKLVYQDRPLTWDDAAVLRRAIRQYQTAAAQMQVGKGEIKSELGDERQTIVVQESAEQTDLFSPSGPLDRSELELLLVSADSGLLNLLLPKSPVAVGDSWEPAKEVLTRLLRLEVINATDVKLTLSKLEGTTATLEIQGKVSGGVEGVTSDLELTGKLNFDTEKKLCTWLALDLKEDRAPNSGAPGFKTTSRIRVAAAPSETLPEISDDAIADMKTTPDEATRLLRFASANQGFELIYEPHWRVVSDTHELAVLRLMERGDLVAQCNVSRLTPLAKGEQLTLEGYQEELKRSLGKTFVEFVEGGESLSESGLRVLRVVASADVSEVPIHYVFYHLSDDQQNRASVAFTMDAEMAERFARSDETLVGSFQFTALPSKPSTSKDQAKKPSGTLKK